jgi:hypothetical protein
MPQNGKFVLLAPKPNPAHQNLNFLFAAGHLLPFYLSSFYFLICHLLVGYVFFKLVRDK